MTNQEVRVWEEDIWIPTYEVGTPDKNPMFLEKRVYQGSSGKVYPYPVIDKIYDEKKEKKYRAVYLENEYLLIMILPELGGRIQRALDKTNQYDFVYYNEVIKPALVGLAGPWISGGIEFNWPQHHRPSTFSPLDYRLSENEDGSKTVWVNEIDPMYGTKGMAGFTLYPSKAYLEIHGQLYNRSNLAQTFLWWANPAVAVNDHTFSVFPPDVHAVYDHGKRDVSTFPIATGTYYKVDYSKGVDISRYKNIPVPTSYMAYRSEADFVGGYDESKKAGILHIADHHLSPGKKQWTWGNGDFGQAWDRNLTDKNGPYIELMTGIYTDNQPDFTWLKPFEEKSFKQYFMPYKEVGMVKAATLDLSIGCDFQENELLHAKSSLAKICVYATSLFENARICITTTLKEKEMISSQLLLEEPFDLSPLSVYKRELTLSPEQAKHLQISVYDQNLRLLGSYLTQEEDEPVIPEAATPVLAPKDVESLEELYLIGLHIEQYRHATYKAQDYYLEGLARDASDIRLNTAYGTLLLRNGLFQECENYFLRAIKKLQLRNPNPYDSEPLYLLALSYFYQERYQEAYGYFRKAAWSNEQQEYAYYYCACILSQQHNPKEALHFVELALTKNTRNLKARGLKASLLRILHHEEAAACYRRETLGIDPFEMRSFYEESQKEAFDEGSLQKETFQKQMRNEVNSYLELAIDYAESGFYQEALAVLELCSVKHPMLFYYKAYYAAKLQEPFMFHLEEAQKAPSLYCFPNKLTDILVLEFALVQLPLGDKAYYYLGNLWFDKKQYEKAYRYFQEATRLNPNFATPYRNLALLSYNQFGQLDQALAFLEKAFSLDPSDARVLMELDQLYKKAKLAPLDRLAFLEKHLSLTQVRDDLYIEYISLHNLLGHYQKAYDLLMQRHFHPWEGGEGKVSSQYVLSLVELALHHPNALELLSKAQSYPHNLGEGKLVGTLDNHIHYFLARIYARLGYEPESQKHALLATLGNEDLSGSMFYNDQPADMMLYQGLAQVHLGKIEEAQEKFHKLIAYGEEHLQDPMSIDFFAVSLPDFLVFDEDLDVKNQAHCYYLMGLGHLGLSLLKPTALDLKEKELAQAAFDKTLTLDPYHQGANLHRNHREVLYEKNRF